MSWSGKSPENDYRQREMLVGRLKSRLTIGTEKGNEIKAEWLKQNKRENGTGGWRLSQG